MGIVYRATGPSGEIVALKVVKGEIAKDDVFRRRFDREARTAARVGHPNVVPVLDSGEHDGIPYMAQQFITGGALENRIKHDGRLALPFTPHVCTQGADGLDAMHAEGLFHPGGKPAKPRSPAGEK